MKISSKIRRTFVSILLLVCIQYLNAQTSAKNGIVVSSNSLSSSIGIEILKKGGNAIDAAVATAFSLAVTLPGAGNIGGGGFLIYMKPDGDVITIDFREKAPLAATNDMFLDKDGKLNIYINHLSAKAIGVPGTVAGLYLAHKKYGKLAWKEVVQPAIELAEKGFVFNWSLFEEANYIKNNVFIKPFLKSYYINANGEITEPGDIWKQPKLANTLSLIRDHGSDGFYKGSVADKIDKYMKENEGLITKEDLLKYEAIERIPIKGRYKDFDIYSMPPPSSGGVALIEMMNCMELVNLDTIQFNSANYIHIITEVMRRAFADRAEFMGDPDYNLNMPIERLISKDFAKIRYENIDMIKASKSDSSKFGQIYDGNNTTHLSVLDNERGAVSLTFTLEYWWGSQMGIDDLGFLFNNEMGDFNSKPGLTDNEGQIGTYPNLIQPEKRMLSSMTPTIVAKGGKPYLVIGGPGGRTIINTVFQTILNVLEFKMPLEKAIETLKVHHEWLPDEILYEKYLLSPDIIKLLERKGHKLKDVYELGELMGIMFDFKSGILIGVSDSSSPEGCAVGY